MLATVKRFNSIVLSIRHCFWKTCKVYRVSPKLSSLLEVLLHVVSADVLQITVCVLFCLDIFNALHGLLLRKLQCLSVKIVPCGTIQAGSCPHHSVA